MYIYTKGYAYEKEKQEITLTSQAASQQAADQPPGLAVTGAML